MNLLEQPPHQGPVGCCHEVQDRLAGQARITHAQNGLCGARGGDDHAIGAHLDEQIRRRECERDVTISLEAQTPDGFDR